MYKMFRERYSESLAKGKVTFRETPVSRCKNIDHRSHTHAHIHAAAKYVRKHRHATTMTYDVYHERVNKSCTQIVSAYFIIVCKPGFSIEAGVYLLGSAHQPNAQAEPHRWACLKPLALGSSAMEPLWTALLKR